MVNLVYDFNLFFLNLFLIYDIYLSNEVREFVFNGQFNKPKFSLLISSHLMYGLVILLHKKDVYLYGK